MAPLELTIEEVARQPTREVLEALMDFDAPRWIIDALIEQLDEEQLKALGSVISEVAELY